MSALSASRWEKTAFRGFFERQYHLYRRYWVWEVVWFLYSVATVLSVGYLASGLGAIGAGETADGVRRAQVYLLVGALLWTFMSLLFHETSFAIAWERWEGTIEYTFMAPVRRLTHLAGVSFFSLFYGLLRSALILIAVVLLIHVDLNHADFAAAALVLAASTVPLMGLGIFVAILPLLSPEKGEQMTFAVQGILLLVSGVYYPLTVLPGAFQVIGHASPLTYTLQGVRDALINHTGIVDLLPTVGLLLAMGVVLILGGLMAFAAAERRAKRMGLLKRNG
ncbi:MAG TPA: ABC transporter permease [Candidatus Dormibacteraeota bacterium]